MSDIDEIRARFFAGVASATQGSIDGYHEAVMAVFDGAQKKIEELTAALDAATARAERAEAALGEANRSLAICRKAHAGLDAMFYEERARAEKAESALQASEAALGEAQEESEAARSAAHDFDLALRASEKRRGELETENARLVGERDAAVEAFAKRIGVTKDDALAALRSVLGGRDGE